MDMIRALINSFRRYLKKKYPKKKYFKNLYSAVQNIQNNENS